MPVIPKIAGCTSIVSSLYDIHKTAMLYSKQEYNKAMGNITMARSIGTQKADYVSYKDAQRKNWVNKHQFFSGINESIASVKGYFKGVVSGTVRYAPKILVSLGAIIPKASKDKTTFGMGLSYVSTIALACIEAWDFLRNGTGLFEKRDYLEKR